MGQPKRFLIFNNGMIGNTLFNMPAAAWLKKEYPGCFVGMVVDKVGLNLVQADPNVDVFHTFNKKKDSLGYQFKLIMTLRREKYDASLHLRKGVRNEVLARLAGVKLRAGYRLKGSPQHLHVKLEEDTSVHRLTSRAILMEAALDAKVELERPRLYPITEAETEVDGLLATAATKRGGYYVLHPTGDSQGGIGWSLPIYAEVVQRLSKQAPVFVICMPNEQSTVEAQIPAGENVHYYTGSIAATADLIRSAKAFMGNDSGPAHMACAWNTPRLVVYRDNDNNFTKWQPIDMTGCEVLYESTFNPDAIINAISKLEGSA